MKRLGLVLGTLLAAASVLFSPAVARADAVNNFTITDYDIHYDLTTNREGRSVLKTTETITADFPAADENHGIERAIPKKYQDHPVNLSIDQVTDQRNRPLRYSTSSDDNDNLVVRIGDANTYVHGSHTYKIVYTEHDVTGYFSDTKDDEFYWDTNGTEWAVPINHLTVSLNVASNIAATLNGQTSCYSGAEGSSNECQLTKTGNTFTTSANNLGAGDNVTIAVGFTAGTFRGYQVSASEVIRHVLFVVWLSLFVVGLVAIVLVSLWYMRLSDRTKAIGTVVAEYTPPAGMSVTTSASLISGAQSVFAAQLIDFAVRGYISITELEKKLLMFKSKDYRIEIIKDISDLLGEEKEILRDIFSTQAITVGQQLKLSKLKNNNTVFKATLDNTWKLNQLLRGSYGLRAKDKSVSHRLRRAAFILLIVAVLTLNPFFFIACLICFIGSYTIWPLTDKGVALARYLRGLKLYIKVAEADRIRMLQSVEGAQKTGGIDPTNKEQLVKLYEKTLPYAMLFGDEKTWNAQIGRYYEELDTQPQWYFGVNPVFSALAFNEAISSFSTSAGYSASSSSSSGGSSGGGFSGGGGGGGGGGGW